MRKITRLMSPSSSEESKKNTIDQSESLIEVHTCNSNTFPKKKGPGAIIKKKY